MRTIQIRLDDPASIDRAIDAIEGLENRLPARCREFCMRLAEIGVNVARTVYTAALYAGTNDTSVHVEMAENGCRIVANGTALGFIEFGTGVKYPLGEFADQAGAPPHGIYGKGNGRKRSWGYYGDPGNYGRTVANKAGKTLVITDGNPPANAFPQAVGEIEAQVLQIAREVFSID